MNVTGQLYQGMLHFWGMDAKKTEEEFWKRDQESLPAGLEGNACQGRVRRIPGRGRDRGVDLER